MGNSDETVSKIKLTFEPRKIQTPDHLISRKKDSMLVRKYIVSWLILFSKAAINLKLCLIFKNASKVHGKRKTIVTDNKNDFGLILPL